VPAKRLDTLPSGVDRSAVTRRLRPRPNAAPRGPERVAFTWYAPGQWARLRALAADPEALDRGFEAWLANAERLEAALIRKGIAVERVLVDVDALAHWCGSRRRPLDSSARSEYVALVLRSRYARSHGEAETSRPGGTVLRRR
jgi:hypothetical protein